MISAIPVGVFFFKTKGIIPSGLARFITKEVATF